MSTKQSPSLSTLATLSYLTLIALLIFALSMPARWLLADLSISTVRRNLESWNQTESNPSMAMWNSTYAALENAIALNPKQGDYYSLKGLLHEWHGFIVADQQGPQGASPLSSQQDAAAAYRRSAELRPSWPDAWANLARQKTLIGELDEEFLAALDRALNLGSWEPRIQLLVTDITTLVWPFPASETELRTKAITNIQRTFERAGNIHQNIDLVQSRGLLEEICPLLNKELIDPRAQQACQQVAPFSYILLP